MTTTGPFKLQATQYRDIGFNPVPIRPNTKNPAPSRWQTGRQEDHVFQSWLDQYPDHGLGVLLGTPLEAVLHGGADLRGQFLIAVDVDQDALSEAIRHALRIAHPRICATRGRKGITIFARGDADQKNRRIQRREINGTIKTLVEILAAGSQTVIPPTVHPETRVAYAWIGVPLHQARMRDLPELTDSVMMELLAVCAGERCEPFDTLRTMVWAGEGGGGHTHDTGVSAVASLVAHGWKDTPIHERIEFAKREAGARAGVDDDWPGSSRTIQEWIDSARNAGMDDTGANAGKASLNRILAAWLIEQFGGMEACLSLGRGILHYRDGHWVETGIDQRELEHLVLEHFPHIDVLKARGAVETALGLLRKRDDQFGHTDAARLMVCTRGGTLDARTLEVERWSADHQLLHQARARWDPEAQCPRYERHVRGLFNDDQEKIDTLEEFFGWTFVQDVSYQKALFIVGPSGIGKSTLTDLLDAIHGEGATSGVALDRLNDPRARAGLIGKLVNISSEKSHGHGVADDIVKKIVTGEIIDGKRLYKNLIFFRPHARLIGTVNEMPTMTDHAGLARRVLPLHCVKPFVPSDQERLRADTLLNFLLEERDGVFTRWMRALHRLIEHGRFTISNAIRDDITKDVEASAGLTRMWLRECCAPTTHPKDYASNDALWNAHTAWALRHAGSDTDRHTSIITWGKAMKRLGYPAVTARRGHECIKARKLMLKRHPSTRDGDPGY